MRSKIIILLAGALLSCDTGSDPADPNAGEPRAKDPATAVRASIDRFSDTAGVLFIRDGQNGLPAANTPVDLDAAPFITHGFGPAGQKVRYYNLDVQPAVPRPVYEFFYENTGAPVPGQLNIIDLIPGDDGYTDFWLLYKVFVPDEYTVNSVTSERGIVDAALRVEAQQQIINCPVVPEGSTASERWGNATALLSQGWYRDLVVFYFTFVEKELVPAGGSVPVSPIYVTFNINPGQLGGGPPSGFRMETGTQQTHNVVATLPTDAAYSPLWQVNMYDNANFSAVSNLATALAAPILVANAALVNCPVVWME